MASISASTAEKVISLKQFLGLNENPEGDNKLKTGEAAVCRNFKITNSGTLMKRYGSTLKYTLGFDAASITKSSSTITSPAVVTADFKAAVQNSGTYVFSYDTDHWELDGETVTIADYGISYSGTETDEDTLTVVLKLGIEQPVKGIWHGYCSHHELAIAACDGHLWMLQDDEIKKYPIDLGAITTTNDVFMFGFDEQVFMLNGAEYGHVYFDDTPVSASATATVTGSITAATVTVATFAQMVDSGGIYSFYYTDNGWATGLSTLVDLTDYGIAVTGTEAIGDTITVAYTAYQAGSWVYENLADGSHGYRPLVSVAIGPQPGGGGELLEEVNKLNGMRRAWISTDGVGDTFKMPEVFHSIDYITDLGTGSTVPAADYSWTADTDEVTFDSPPALAVNGYEIGYTVTTNFASTVSAMRYAEMYAGTQDSRIFIYGDGTNRTFYSGIDYLGHARGDYFPDLYEVTVGDSNTPITSLIRHYSRMLAFKPEATYSIDYGIVTLADSSLTPAFYTAPINRILGNEALGQAQMVLNAPRTLCKGSLYEWRSGSSYAANLSVDERQAKRISDRITDTLHKMDFSKCHCYDDNLNTEYYIIDGDGNCLVHNYTVDAWYYYTGLKARLMMNVGEDLYIGTTDGKIILLDKKKMADQGQPIDCYWESGAMDFGASYMRKYSALMWVGVKAENNSAVTVTVKTDRSEENTEVDVEPDFDFDMPKITRTKVKVKKFVFYKLIFKTNSAGTRCTVVDTEIKVRYTAQAK